MTRTRVETEGTEATGTEVTETTGTEATEATGFHTEALRH